MRATEVFGLRESIGAEYSAIERGQRHQQLDDTECARSHDEGKVSRDSVELGVSDPIVLYHEIAEPGYLQLSLYGG